MCVYFVRNTYGRTPLTVRFVLYIAPISFVLLVDLQFCTYTVVLTRIGNTSQ